jgi:anti-sigma regulatory factor (Ser/Thr protein kinase)
MVVVERGAGFENGSQEPPTIPGWRLLSEFEIESTPGNERKAVEKVLDAVRELDLGASILTRLKTAVAECSMNAIEHGNQYQEELTVGIQVLVSDRSLSIRITDCGGEKEIPAHTSPNLESKLAGRDSTRGWGLFLIRNMVDEMNIYSDGNHHTFDLVLHLNEGQHESSIV